MQVTVVAEDLGYHLTKVISQNLIKRKLGGDWIRLMLATIQSRTFLPPCLLSKIIRFKIYKQNYNFALYFCAGFKFGL
jgi:hypothetical protein